VALDEAVAAQAYRIAQEAVTNAVRHARAGCVCLTLRGGDGRVVLRVEDDGVGLGPDARGGQGMGLRIMRHRAQAVGGRLRMQRGADGGTAVVCALPAARSGAAREVHR
jgi:signal transduction histidine kinase